MLSKKAPKETAEESTRRRGALILCFACMLALLLLLIFDFQRRMVPPFDATIIFSQARWRNSTVFGRRFMLGEGEYFVRMPYAYPTKRFELPRLHTSPPPQMNATHFHNGCPHGYHFTDPLRNSLKSPPELFCHTLNIYRCNEVVVGGGGGTRRPSPVLVYLHEGHWLTRSNSNLDPRSTFNHLACRDERMVVVSINYRLGFYGFFSPPPPMEQADFALEDVRTALQWVKEFIGDFGGDSNRVTVMARGVGAQLASAISLQQGQGLLFHQLVLLAGSSFAPTLSLRNGPATNPSMDFALQSRCVKSADEWINFQSLNRSEQGRIEYCLTEMGHDVVEQVEGDRHEKTFIRWPLVGAAKTRRPTIFGSCHRPRLMRRTGHPPLLGISNATEQLLRERLNQYVDLQQLPNSQSIIQFYLDSMRRGELLERSRQHDRIDASITEEGLSHLVEAVRQDLVETGPMLLEALQRAEHNEGQVYFFDYEAPIWLNRSQIDIASIGEEISFVNATDPAVHLPCIDDLLFNPLDSELSGDAHDLSLQRTIRDAFAQYLSNFVHSGDPNLSSPKTMNQAMMRLYKSSSLPQWPRFVHWINPQPYNPLRPPLDLQGSVPLWARKRAQESGIVLHLRNEEEGVAAGKGILPRTYRSFWLCEMSRYTEGMTPPKYCNSQWDFT